MFWKKKSETYYLLIQKLAKYVNIRFDNFGSKEYLPTKSDLDNLSEGELTKFIEKEIQDNINIHKNSLKISESHLVSPSLQDPENIASSKRLIKEEKEVLRYYGEFLEAIEAGGLKEKASEEKASGGNEDITSLINKKDGSAVTYFLNQTIENQDEVSSWNPKMYCNTLFNLFKFFTLKRTPISDEFESGNFLEGLSQFYEVFAEVDKIKVPEEVKNYISNGQMESELNEEHFKILKDGIHKLCVTTQDEFDTLKNYLGFSDTETHTHLTYILYSKNNPKMAAIKLKVDDTELDSLYKEFSQLLNEDELNTLYENAEKYRIEYIEELVEKVSKERTKRLDYENYSVDLSAYLSLASNHALDANIAGRLKGKALLQEILDQKIADDAQEEEAKKYLEWF
tara:strand:- start:19 stop:1212 length:1194 start_codon:yes stop_codon:yes gene_type:complete